MLRPEQAAIVDQIGDEGVYFLDAPTGSGKSYIAEALASRWIQSGAAKRVWIVVHNTTLQYQYQHDFPHIHNFMGKTHYDCPVVLSLGWSADAKNARHRPQKHPQNRFHRPKNAHSQAPKPVQQPKKRPNNPYDSLSRTKKPVPQPKNQAKITTKNAPESTRASQKTYSIVVVPAQD